MMVMMSRPGTTWAQPGADGVLEIPVHPDLPTILHLPDAITRARVTGSSIQVTFAGRTLHVRPNAGVSAGLEALLEVETVTMLLTFRLRVVARYEDARDELMVVAMKPEQRAEQSPPDGEARPAPAAPDATMLAAGEPVVDTSPEIPVHARVTTYLVFPDEIVRARFSGLVTGMMRATSIDNRLLIRPSAGLAVGDEVPVRVQTATVRQRFRLRVVPRAADAWRHVVVLPPAAAVSSTPPEPSATPITLARAVRMMLGRFMARDADAWAPMSIASTTGASTTGHGAAPATERAGAAARPPRVAISIHAIAALAGTTEFTVPGYQGRQARRSHRAGGVRVTGRRPGASWGVEASVSGEWPVAPTVHIMESGTELAMRGPWLRADVGLKAWFGGTWLVPTASVGLGLQAHYRDVDINESDESEEIDSSQGMPFVGVLAASMGLEYRVTNLSLGLELHVRQGVPAEYRSVSALLSAGWSLDQGE